MKGLVSGMVSVSKVHLWCIFCNLSKTSRSFPSGLVAQGYSLGNFPRDCYWLKSVHVSSNKFADNIEPDFSRGRQSMEEAQAEAGRRRDQGPTVPLCAVGRHRPKVLLQNKK